MNAMDRIPAILARMPKPERKFAVFKLLALIDELDAANDAGCAEATAKGLSGRAAIRVFQRHFKAVLKRNETETLADDLEKLLSDYRKLDHRLSSILHRARCEEQTEGRIFDLMNGAEK